VSARLSDLLAPPWRHTFEEVTRTMRPLSLQTFAELEGLGISFDSLSAGNTEGWVRMYTYLAGLRDPQDLPIILKSIRLDPLGFQVFQKLLESAFAGSKDGEGPTVVHRRTVKDPREAAKSEGRSETDMAWLVTLARMSGVPLSDLFRMSFRGIHAVQASLQDMPPTNPGAMLGL